MAVPKQYQHICTKTKFFLSSYRAIIDGRHGISSLENLLESSKFFLGEWKVIWIGTCATIRTSIDLFQVDIKSCIDQKIRNEIKEEWRIIKSDRESHAIFWDFLREERNNIIHQYEWRAYQVWLDEEGIEQQVSILGGTEGAKPHILMRSGRYAGRNSLELLQEAADWAEDRVFTAIRRAGFDPEEERGIVDFNIRPEHAPGVLAHLLAGKTVA